MTGEILTHHVRSIDTQARPIIFVKQTVTPDILTEVRLKLATLIGLGDEAI